MVNFFTYEILTHKPLLQKVLGHFNTHLKHVSVAVRVGCTFKYEKSTGGLVFIVLTCINFFFKQHLLWNYRANIDQLNRNVPLMVFFQSYLSGSSPLHKMTTTAKDRKSFKRHLWNHSARIDETYQKCFLVLYESCLNGFSPLHVWLPEIKKMEKTNSKNQHWWNFTGMFVK